jgi:hypothetical protein
MLTRRDFVHAGCAIAAASLAPDSAEAWIHGLATTVFNGGKAQVNLNPAPYEDMWAINFCKMAGPWQASGASDGTWPSLLNSTGYPTGMPNGVGAKWISQQLYGYGIAGDVWVLDWQGSATFSLATNGWASGSISQTLNTANRQEYTLAGNPQWTDSGLPTAALLLQLSITAISTTPSNIRLYRKDQESLIDGSGATSIFNPNFLSRTQSFGVLRFMDYVNCNANRIYKWDYINTAANFSWLYQYTNGAWFYGVASQSFNTYTVSTLPTLTDGLPIQFWMPARPVTLTVTATAVGSPTQFTIANHGLSNGQKITAVPFNDGGGSWTTAMTNKVVATGLPPDFVVTVIDANTITIPLNSTGFAAPSGTFLLMPELTITDGVQSGRVVSTFLINPTSSEYSTYASGGLITAIWDATFGIFIMKGDDNGFSAGVPPSVLITLCNYCGAHPWFTYPFTVESSFWTNLATLWKATGAANLIPRFESGNEIWNTSFAQTAYAQSLAALLYGTTGFGQSAADLGYATRINTTSAAIAAVLGNGSNWKMVMGVQGVNSGGSQTNRFQGNATINGGTSAGYPGNKSDLIAFAPYVLPMFSGSAAVAANYPGLLDQIDNFNQSDTTDAYNFLLTEMSTPSDPTFTNGKTLQQLDGWVNTYAAGWISVAAGYTGRQGVGLEVHHYEGGNGANPSNFSSSGFPTTAPISGRTVTYANLQSMWFGFLASAQMGTFETSYLTRMAAAGIKYPSQYYLTGIWLTTDLWGAYRTNVLGSGPTPWYTALLNWNAP